MNIKMLKKYHQINVRLDTGAEFITKIKGENLSEVSNWLDRLPGIASYEEVKATNPMAPHATGKLKKKTKITEARLAAGLTQEELADLIGVGRTQIQRWEYGYNHVRVDVLMRIGEALGVNWTDLIEDE